MSERLRVVVRADLSPAQQAVQAIHAHGQFATEFPVPLFEWLGGSNTLALLSVADELELEHLLDLAREKGVRVSAFYEPDIGNRMTAICLEPSEVARKLCKGLAPALRDP